MYFTLEFTDGPEKCELLGTVIVDEKKYAAFLGSRTHHIYLYRLVWKRNGEKLVQIKDKKEFAMVCDEMNKIVNKTVKENMRKEREKRNAEQ